MVINKHTLENGLRVVHYENQSTQMVTLNIVYNVGARNEDENHTGFAHLFEHLMFGGSVNIPDYDTPLQMAGGENNAYTTNDYTNYYLTVPASNVETGFWLESDRMLSLAFTPESLEVQRHVVVEEFKQHYINQPYGDTSHLLSEMAYKVHPYRWPTIGLTPEHIEKATMDEVKDFFFRFYTPENAILSVVGNISFEETVRLAEKWFGTIPRRTTTACPIPQEPPQQRQRRKTVYRNVPNNILYMAFHICSRTDEEFYACDMISDVLANGRSCRLYHNLVERDHLFTSIDAYITSRTDAGMLYIIGMPAEGVDMRIAENAVWRELEILRNELVPETELEKLKNKYESTNCMERTDNQYIAAQLAVFEMYGDANDLDKEVERYRNVTAEQLRRTCRKVLTRKNSCILSYMKKK
ncbi:MAG: insulinase family protein [Bacteroides sp.]|nr:insulinase family protein [Roseburia sp.]MCM1346948.1 insulinase family protein [Bacteroides sp.]MCM1421507.1 insulinase family protein [Bacteroides sp.]